MSHEAPESLTASTKGSMLKINTKLPAATTSGEQLPMQAPGIMGLLVCLGRELSKHRAVISMQLAEILSVNITSQILSAALNFISSHPILNAVVLYSYLTKKVHYQHPF